MHFNENGAEVFEKSAISIPIENELAESAYQRATILWCDRARKSGRKSWKSVQIFEYVFFKYMYEKVWEPLGLGILV